MNPNAYILDAACVKFPSEWWDIETGTLTKENVRALRICGTCPVKDKCLARAKEQDTSYSIRGGNVFNKRGKLRRGKCDR